MLLGSLRRPITAVLMAVAIFLVGMPIVPTNAAPDCDQMVSMEMDVKSAPVKSHHTPSKSGLLCNDNISCLGGAGCASSSVSHGSVVSLPRMTTTDANWSSQHSGPSITYKPALPPPRV